MDIHNNLIVAASGAREASRVVMPLEIGTVSRSERARAWQADGPGVIADTANQDIKRHIVCDALRGLKRLAKRQSHLAQLEVEVGRDLERVLRVAAGLDDGLDVAALRAGIDLPGVESVAFEAAVGDDVCGRSESSAVDSLGNGGGCRRRDGLPGSGGCRGGEVGGFGLAIVSSLFFLSQGG